MSMLPGILTINDTERTYVQTVGQQLVFDAITQIMAEYNRSIALQIQAFVERDTEAFKFRHLLPGIGLMQRMGTQAPAGAVKRGGKYDVALPLRQWGSVIGGNRVDLGYMSIAVLDTHLDSIMLSDTDVLRERILTALFEDTTLTFDDHIQGNLTVKHLANGDTDVYPPVHGTRTEAIDDHYLNSGYTVAAIAAANNPVPTLVQEIAEHYNGTGVQGKEFVYFHGNDQLDYLTAIAGYNAINDQWVSRAADTQYAINWPDVPGRIHGRGWGAWIVEWDGWIPDTYGLMVLQGSGIPAPCYRRVDPADTGLGRGLQLVAEDVNHPLERSHYENRYGIGVVNRLPAAVMLIDESGVYTPPTAYTEP